MCCWRWACAREVVASSLRFSLGAETTADEIDEAVGRILATTTNFTPASHRPAVAGGRSDSGPVIPGQARPCRSSSRVLHCWVPTRVLASAGCPGETISFLPIAKNLDGVRSWV